MKTFDKITCPVCFRLVVEHTRKEAKTCYNTGINSITGIDNK